MSKKELKLQNKDLEISIIDILASLDPSETNKFTPFLIKMLRKEMNHPELRKFRSKGKIVNNIIEEHMISFILNFIGEENFETIKSFHVNLENNRISENKRDINQYNSWEELEKEVNLANLKLQQKHLEKQVLKVLENEEWLIIRPLTLESSLAYGAGTKWCTSMKNNSEYFYRYSQNGVLTYAINTKTGDKYGIYFDHNSGEFSIWNAPDRRIDSVESTIPSDMIKMIYEMAKKENRNYEYFSEEEKKKADRSDSRKESYTEEVARPTGEVYEGDIDVELRTEPMEMEVPMDEVVEVETDNGQMLNIVWRGNMEGTERVYEQVDEVPQRERDPWEGVIGVERGDLR